MRLSVTNKGTIATNDLARILLRLIPNGSGGFVPGAGGTVNSLHAQCYLPAGITSTAGPATFEPPPIKMDELDRIMYTTSVQDTAADVHLEGTLYVEEFEF